MLFSYPFSFTRFGKVYQGTYKGNDVAIKMYSSLTKEDNEGEANMFAKLKSNYIVGFFGICVFFFSVFLHETQQPSINAMVIEFCKYGSLGSLYDRSELNQEMKLLMTYDCAMGMQVFDV